MLPTPYYTTPLSMYYFKLTRYIYTFYNFFPYVAKRSTPSTPRTLLKR